MAKIQKLFCEYHKAAMIDGSQTQSPTLLDDLASHAAAIRSDGELEAGLVYALVEILTRNSRYSVQRKSSQSVQALYGLWHDDVFPVSYDRDQIRIARERFLHLLRLDPKSTYFNLAVAVMKHENSTGWHSILAACAVWTWKALVAAQRLLN